VYTDSGLRGLGWKSLLVAIVSFAFFAQGVERTGVASALANAVDHIQAQDESVYANAALRMAARGNWLTPVVMGRIFLFKPPLLYVASALSLKTFGLSLFALRLPSMLAGSLTAALLFYWCARIRGLWAGIAAVLLLLANSVWFTFARLCYTDLLLAFFTAGAMFSMARDPRLETTAARWSFIVFDAAAILTKSVAGIVPLFGLALFAWLGPREERPTPSRIVRMGAWIGLLILPWHLYQLAVHRQWFWTDFVEVQLLQFGVRPVFAGSTEVPVWFYLKRLFLTDPFLCVAAAIAVPAWVTEIRHRSGNARLLACWLAVVFACISLFQYRNFAYALMLVAPLCLLAACYVPAKAQRWAVALLVLILGAKVVFHDQVWSLSYSASHPLTAAPLLRSYMARGRSNELVLVDTDDQFYSSTLPLPKVRFCYRDPDNLTARYAPYYVDLGITVQTAVFDDLDRWAPIFRARLRAWGLDSDDPIATVIVARNDAEVASMVHSHPETDFYLPANLDTALRAAQDTHVYVPASPGRFFLLAKHSSRAPLRSGMLP
jgi:4-amino-4-deoxy-L-arabinose transferase-like glycosyltransferase